ncbi:MAG: hypothetical protein C4K58_06865 [Flavobacteriaceae bacterium]|nr:MAG: hypothetical protein C4K58_06865 [Flavobacteriaceae bacterium]
MTTAKKNNQTVKILVEAIQSRRQLWRKEINDWQAGRRAFYAVENPSTYLLQEVYQDVMLDDQLTTVTDQRTLRTQNKMFVILGQDETENPDKTKLIQKQWFYKLIKEAISSIYYGYSLMMPIIKDGELHDMHSIDRRNVLPKTKQLLPRYYDQKGGVNIEDYPEILLYVQLGDPSGLLEKAAPLTILKRHSWSSWDEFEQIFGIPLRIAKYAGGNPAVKEELVGWMQEMGTAAYAVLPQEAEVEIKENSKGDAFNVFLQKIKRADEGLSKLILGQTMTTDSGSSLSQAEVHQGTLEEIIMADERSLLLWLNDCVKPFLIGLNIGIDENDFFGVAKATNPKEQIEIDSKLMSGGIRLSKNYVERTYGVEVDSIDDKATPDPQKKK